MTISVDRDRLWGFHMALAELTEPDRPYTRRAFGELHRQGRRWIEGRMREAGLAISYDDAGNLIGRLEGRERPDRVIMTGSHSDTVPSGGRFDGISGVLTGLEVAQSFRDAGFQPRHSFEVVDFLSEEPSDFGVSSIGSRAMAGHLRPELLSETDPSGATLKEAIQKAGGSAGNLNGPLRPASSVMAFVELHIEQGKVLEASETEIGVVTNIVGIRRLQVVVNGQADHAGTTPMDLRKDAMAGAARIIDWIQREAHRKAAGNEGYLVATVGHLNVHPNGANVVADRVDFLIDLRSDRSDWIDAFTADLAAAGPSLSEDLGVTVEQRQLTDSTPTDCDPGMQQHLTEVCRTRGYSHRAMPSGAGHDAVYVAKFAPAAMVFIPCLDGRSHCAEEWTEPEQLERGANVVLDLVRTIDRQS